MKLVIILLGIAIIIPLGIMRTQSNNIGELQNEVRDLNAKLAERSKAEEAQAECAAQAGQVFSASGYSRNEFATYASHYAPALDKCIVRLVHTDTQAGGGRMIWAYVNVVDVSNRKQYGTYAWHTETSKKYAIVPPVTCEVTLPTGEPKSCHSMDEFAKLVKVYMED